MEKNYVLFFLVVLTFSLTFILFLMSTIHKTPTGFAVLETSHPDLKSVVIVTFSLLLIGSSIIYVKTRKKMPKKKRRNFSYSQ